MESYYDWQSKPSLFHDVWNSKITVNVMDIKTGQASVVMQVPTSSWGDYYNNYDPELMKAVAYIEDHFKGIANFHNEFFQEPYSISLIMECNKPW